MHIGFQVPLIVGCLGGSKTVSGYPKMHRELPDTPSAGRMSFSGPNYALQKALPLMELMDAVVSNEIRQVPLVSQ